MVDAPSQMLVEGLILSLGDGERCDEGSLTNLAPPNIVARKESTDDELVMSLLSCVLDLGVCCQLRKTFAKDQHPQLRKLREAMRVTTTQWQSAAQRALDMGILQTGNKNCLELRRSEDAWQIVAKLPWQLHHLGWMRVRWSKHDRM